MKQRIALVLTLTLLLSAIVLAFSSLSVAHAEGLREETYAEDLAALAGEPQPDAKFSTSLTADLKGDTVTVKVTVNGAKTEDKLIGFELPVYFDAERLTPDLSKKDGEALDCFNALPGKNWENLTSASVKTKNNRSYIYIQCGTAKTDYFGDGAFLSCTLTFTLKDGYKRAGVWMSGESVRCFVDDGHLTKYPGNGSFALAEYVPLYADFIASLMGTYTGNKPQLFETEMHAELYRGVLKATLQVKNVKASDKIIGFQIPLYYQAELLDPILTDVDGEALNCIKSGLPGKNWENLTAAKVVEREGNTCIYIQCGTAKSDCCPDGDGPVFEVSFRLKEGFTEAGVWTTAEDVQCFVDDADLSFYPGKPSCATAMYQPQPEALDDLPPEAAPLSGAGGVSSCFILTGNDESVPQMAERLGIDMGIVRVLVHVGPDGRVRAVAPRLGWGEPPVCRAPSEFILCLCEGVEPARFQVGAQIILYNVNLEGIAAMDRTPELIDAGFEVIPPEPVALVGDVNLDGEVDALDYLQLKKIILGSFTRRPEQTDDILDLNGDESVDAIDYIMLKRMVLNK